LGFANNQQIEQGETGFTYLGGDVTCGGCPHDVHVSAFVRHDGEPGTCSFCGRSATVLDLHRLFVEMGKRIRPEFLPSSISPEVPGREWEIDALSASSVELLDMLDLPLGEGALADAFVGAFENDWIAVGVWAGTPEEWLSEGWDRFVQVVKRESRFVFLHPATAAPPYRSADIDPTQMLDRLGDALKRCGAIIPFPAGQPIFRARKHAPSEVLTTPEDLGSPNADIAGAQRMSPPGIPFFYSACEERTALAEVRGIDGECATDAQWVTDRETHIVDLARLAEVPSIFDLSRAALRPELRFLRRFAQEISKPIRAHDNPAVDYVPTQIVAEYIRRCVKTDFDEPVEGIMYPSAVVSGGTNLAFFEGPTGQVPLRLVGPIRRFVAGAMRTDWSLL